MFAVYLMVLQVVRGVFKCVLDIDSSRSFFWHLVPDPVAVAPGPGPARAGREGRAEQHQLRGAVVPGLAAEHLRAERVAKIARPTTHTLNTQTLPSNP